MIAPRYCLNHGSFHRWRLHAIEGPVEDSDRPGRYVVWYCDTCRWLEREPLKEGSPFHHASNTGTERDK